MAGQPAARAEMGVLEHMGIDKICEFRSSGLSVREVGELCGCSRHTLTRWLHRDTPGDQEGTRWQLWLAAGITLAETLVEKGREGLERAPLDRDAIALAKAQAEQYRWEASKRHRAAWGEQPTTAIQINAGDLHLQAMRQPPPAQVLSHVEVPLPKQLGPVESEDDFDSFYETEDP